MRVEVENKFIVYLGSLIKEGVHSKDPDVEDNVTCTPPNRELALEHHVIGQVDSLKILEV